MNVPSAFSFLSQYGISVATYVGVHAMDARERRRLVQQRKLLGNRLASIEEFLRGSVVLMKRKCTYPGCRKCATGQRHPTWVLTYSQAGKTRTVYLGRQRVAAARQLVRNYRQLTQLLEQLAQVNLALFTQPTPGQKGRPHGPTPPKP